ncbi:MAG: tRNA (guanosine(46)-N7)-methyltransferase TrmB [Pseudomonadota bacterium]
MTSAQNRDEPEKHRAIRSFVLRTGRMTAAQSEALQTNWAQFGLELEQGLIAPEALFGRRAELVVEIGFGMGDSLLEMAIADPQRDFIGIEVHTPGVGRLLAGAKEHGLTNLRVYRADAIAVLNQCLPRQSIDRLQLYFPDPWPKKRHHKRRIVQQSFLDLLSTKLKPGASLHIATDWQPYAEYCIELLEQQALWHNNAGEGQFTEKPDFRPETKFERRGTQLGHGVWDLIFVLAKTSSSSTSSIPQPNNRATFNGRENEGSECPVSTECKPEFGISTKESAYAKPE